MSTKSRIKHQNFVGDTWMIGAFTGTIALSQLLGFSGFLLGISLASFVVSLLAAIEPSTKDEEAVANSTRISNPK